MLTQPTPKPLAPKSTHKLTKKEIQDICDAGALIQWRPKTVAGSLDRRVVFLDPTTYADFNAPTWSRDPLNTKDDPQSRRRQFYATVENFTSGGTPRPNLALKLLKPTSEEFENLWEFRSMPPEPQTRLFGYMAAPGCFIGLWFGLRSYLGDFNNPNWSQTAKLCSTKFSNLFPQHHPMHCTPPVDTVSQLRNYIDEQ